jgi:hypothetical protein
VAIAVGNAKTERTPALGAAGVNAGYCCSFGSPRSTAGTGNSIQSLPRRPCMPGNPYLTRSAKKGEPAVGYLPMRLLQQLVA